MVLPGTAEPEEPRIIGRYALYGEIAAGGMATVHFGRLVGPVGFSRTVAIKRLHPQFAKDPEFVSMFLDEARLAARVQHPNVVATLDVVPLGGEVFLVMEYVQGEALSRLIRAARRRDQRLPARIAIAIMAGVLHGLHAAHEAKSEHGEPLNIVHRDISPQNVLVGVDGVARVLDFGVAKAAMRAQSTRDGQMKGKISYMAPEQLQGQVDRRADIFSAGTVLWEALTGARLFKGESAGQVLNMLAEAPIRPPSSIVPSLPPRLDAIVLRALERDPDRRFQTARELAIALEQTGTVALNREVGEWVQDVGGDTLARRASQVAEIESLSLTDQAVPNALSQWRRGPELVSSVSWSEAPPESVSQVSRVNSVPPASDPAFALALRRRRHRGLGIAALVGVLTVLGVTLVAVKSHQHSNKPATPSATAPVVTPPPAPQKLAPKTALASQPASPPPSASAASAAESPKKTKPKPRRVRVWFRHRVVARKPHHAPTTAKAAATAAKPNCNPPYWLDSNGIQHPKLQCM